MQREEARILETLNRVKQFLTENADNFADVIPPAALAHFSACHEELRAHALIQAQAAREILAHTAAKRALRDQVLALMRRFRLVARARPIQSADFLAITRERPRGYTQIVTSAHGLANAAKPLRDELVAAGLHPDAIEELETAAEALREAITKRGITQSSLVKATIGVRRQAVAARRELQLLASYVRRRSDDPTLRDSWESASRIGPPRRRRLTAGENTRAIGAAPAMRALPPGPRTDAQLASAADSGTGDAESVSPAAPSRRPLLERIADALGRGSAEKSG